MKLPTKAATIAILGDISLILAIVSAIPYELGDIALLVSPELKAKILAISAGSALTLKIIQRITERLQGVEDQKQIEKNTNDISDTKTIVHAIKGDGVQFSVSKK